MYRVALTPRPDWQRQAERLGFTFHTIDGAPYWDESACYRFDSRQVDELDLATATLQELCLAAVAEVIAKERFAELAIPAAYVPLIVRSWEEDEAGVYGRFDLRYDGHGAPKLLEYNADTPTALLEASVVQWYWLQERFPAADQFNSIHEKLIACWQAAPYPKEQILHFACASDSPEDLGTSEYLRDTALQAGYRTRRLDIADLGWDSARQTFVDLEFQEVQTLVKLYPWEWLLAEDFGAHLLTAPLRLVEPAWKLLLSCKGILAILWELFPGHPNLLECRRGDGPPPADFVRKPFYSREGGNITINAAGSISSTPGSYAAGPAVHQRFAPLPEFAGNYPVVGSWVIGGEPAGIGIREDTGLVTSNASRFVPHYFTEA